MEELIFILRLLFISVRHQSSLDWKGIKKSSTLTPNRNSIVIILVRNIEKMIKIGKWRRQQDRHICQKDWKISKAVHSAPWPAPPATRFWLTRETLAKNCTSSYISSICVLLNWRPSSIYTATKTASGCLLEYWNIGILKWKGCRYLQLCHLHCWGVYFTLT